MTRFYIIREIVENSLDYSQKYLNEKDIDSNRDKYFWGKGLVDAYSYILEKIREVEKTDPLVNDEAQ